MQPAYDRKMQPACSLQPAYDRMQASYASCVLRSYAGGDAETHSFR